MLENGVSSDAGASTAASRRSRASASPTTSRGRREPGDRGGDRPTRPATAPATPVDLTAGATYKIAENDFMASGGDGYPNFASRHDDAGHHGAGRGRLHHGALAAEPGRQGRSRTDGSTARTRTAQRRRTARRWLRLRSERGSGARRVRRRAPTPDHKQAATSAARPRRARRRSSQSPVPAAGAPAAGA